MLTLAFQWTDQCTTIATVVVSVLALLGIFGTILSHQEMKTPAEPWAQVEFQKHLETHPELRPLAQQMAEKGFICLSDVETIRDESRKLDKVKANAASIAAAIEPNR